MINPSPVTCLSFAADGVTRLNSVGCADGLCLFTKRLEEGQFIWPAVRDGKVSITRSQLAMLLDKLDWRPAKTSRRNSRQFVKMSLTAL